MQTKYQTFIAPNEAPIHFQPEYTFITFKDVKTNPKVRALIDGANEVMRAMGYTEHGHRHVGVVSSITRYIMESLEATPREIELAQIAGYLHDIGNVVNRINHPMTGGSISFTLLNEMNMSPLEIAPIIGAIGNHEELSGTPLGTMSAALILADKSDVHYTRVQNPIFEIFDIHDRVNYAVQKSRIQMHSDTKIIELILQIDTSFASIMEYFEIFLSRMIMCRKAANVLGHKFAININGTVLE